VGTLKKYKPLLGYITLFYLVMGISKYTQILYFQQNGRLMNFSLAYSAMAVAGSLSFLVANLLEKVALRKVANTLGLVYAVGMFLRVFFQSRVVAIISGSLSGVGAAILILVIRRWLYLEADRNSQDRQFLISSRYTLMQIASLLATLMTGLILFAISASNRVYVIILIASALGIILLPTGSVPSDEIKIEKRSRAITLPDNRVRGLLYLGVVIFMGIATSLVDPIAPAILRSVGYSVASVSLTMAILGIVAMLSAFLFQLPVFNRRPDNYFWLIESVSGIIIIFCGLMKRNQAIWTMVAFGVMAVEGTGFFILKELIEYEMFPKNELVLYLGLAQSGFLIGDAIGAPLGTTLFQLTNSRVLLVVYGTMIMLCGFLYKTLSRSFRRDRCFR